MSKNDLLAHMNSARDIRLNLLSKIRLFDALVHHPSLIGALTAMRGTPTSSFIISLNQTPSLLLYFFFSLLAYMPLEINPV